MFHVQEDNHLMTYVFIREVVNDGVDDDQLLMTINGLAIRR